MPAARPKCPGQYGRAGHCTHYLDEHTARGGCMHRKESGAICGCTHTSGVAQGASPFGAVGAFVPGAAQPAVTTVAVTITPKEIYSMTSTNPTRLFNIAGVAAELNVTPQRASAWHRGPEKTPAPSFVVDGTGLELWTADDITAWSDWVQKTEDEAKAAKEAKKAKPAVEEMPKAEPVAGDQEPTPSKSEGQKASA